MSLYEEYEYSFPYIRDTFTTEERKKCVEGNYHHFVISASSVQNECRNSIQYSLSLFEMLMHFRKIQFLSLFKSSTTIAEPEDKNIILHILSYPYPVFVLLSVVQYTKNKQTSPQNSHVKESQA